MRFTLTIAAEGAAREPQELARLLAHSAGLVQSGILSAPLVDVNGNTVGRFALREV